MKTISLAATLIAALALSIGTAAAEGQGTEKRAENQSDSGAAHGAFANENGNFGFLGELGGTPGYHDGAVGQDPGATGYNNSHVNGNVD
jgi:hypothetical protein